MVPHDGLVGGVLRHVLDMRRRRFSKSSRRREHLHRNGANRCHLWCHQQVLSRYAARTGPTVSLFSRTLFGLVGSALASLIFAATAIYYAVFEGSIIAVAFHELLPRIGKSVGLCQPGIQAGPAPLCLGHRVRGPGLLAHAHGCFELPLKALAWQGVFVTTWVAIALVFIGLNWKAQDKVPDIRPANLKGISPGAVAWVFASAVGIALTEQTAWPVVSQLTPLITMALAAGVYTAPTNSHRRV